MKDWKKIDPPRGQKCSMMICVSERSSTCALGVDGGRRQTEKADTTDVWYGFCMNVVDASALPSEEFV